MPPERKYALTKIAPGVWKWNSPIIAGETVIEVGNWDRWKFWEGPHMTRAEAIKRALEMESR